MNIILTTYLGKIQVKPRKYYKVYVVNRIKGKKSYIGETNYETRTIKIEKGSYSEMVDTLRHELMHIWLYELGYKEQNGGCFTYEQVCEMSAMSNEFIFKETERFKSILKLFFGKGK